MAKLRGLGQRWIPKARFLDDHFCPKNSDNDRTSIKEQDITMRWNNETRDLVDASWWIAESGSKARKGIFFIRHRCQDFPRFLGNELIAKFLQTFCLEPAANSRAFCYLQGLLPLLELATARSLTSQPTPLQPTCEAQIEPRAMSSLLWPTIPEP